MCVTLQIPKLQIQTVQSLSMDIIEEDHWLHQAQNATEKHKLARLEEGKPRLDNRWSCMKSLNEWDHDKRMREKHNALIRAMKRKKVGRGERKVRKRRKSMCIYSTRSLPHFLDDRWFVFQSPAFTCGWRCYHL